MLHPKYVNLPRTLLLFASLVTLLVLSACGVDTTPPAPSLEPAATGTGFAFHIDPEAGTVTPVDPSPIDSLQTQAEPGDTRALVQGQDIRYTDFSFQFRAPNRVIVRLRVQNITDDLSFAQPFSFTLSSTAQNIVEARAPLVTDAQLGGDGVLSPGETSRRFNFQAAFVEDEPFTFFVDTRALVVTSTGCINPANVPDENLEQAIRQTLDTFEDALTCEDLAALETLDTRNVGRVRSLEGLQFAVNLRDLSLAGDNVSDFGPLADLEGLEVLNLSFNELADLSGLENLTNLTLLDLENNNITDISALVANSGLGDGDRVILFGNPLSARAFEDIATLRERGVEVEADVPDPSACTNPVDIPDENLEAALRDALGTTGELTCEDLASLETLDASARSITNLEGLQFASNLTRLNLFVNDIADIDPLAGLTALETLFLGGNTIGDLGALANLTNLRALDLESNDVADLSPLESLTSLDSLFIPNNRIDDVSALVANSGLRDGDRVVLDGNPLSQAFEDIDLLLERGVDVSF